MVKMMGGPQGGAPPLAARVPDARMRARPEWGPRTASCPCPARCLVHIVRSTSLKYCKVRQFQEHFQFDVCRHEVRYGCLREDSCHFAHSFIELKVWLLQQYSGEGAAEGGVQRTPRADGESPGEDVAQARVAAVEVVEVIGFWVCADGGANRSC